jgi:hypothetical protein
MLDDGSLNDSFLFEIHYINFKKVILTLVLGEI